MASSSTMTTSPLQVYLYTRVSNPQTEAEESAHQTAALTKFATEQGWKIEKSYHDKGSGSQTSKLAGMQEMLSDISSNAHPHKMILVFEVSRFSRTWDNALPIFAKLRELKVNVFAVSQYLMWNASSYSANAGFEATLTTAQQEWYLARDRITASVSARKAAGHKLGQAPYGFKRSDDKKSWVENPEEQKQIKQLTQLYQAGMSCYDIADEMKRQGKGPRNMWWIESSVRAQLKRAGVFKARSHTRTGKIARPAKVFSSYKPSSAVHGRHAATMHEFKDFFH
jgi:DNA invertase Pin-like site-specific DNA recombinase